MDGSRMSKREMIFFDSFIRYLLRYMKAGFFGFL